MRERRRTSAGPERLVAPSGRWSRELQFYAVVIVSRHHTAVTTADSLRRHEASGPAAAASPASVRVPESVASIQRVAETTRNVSGGAESEGHERRRQTAGSHRFSVSPVPSAEGVARPQHTTTNTGMRMEPAGASLSDAPLSSSAPAPAGVASAEECAAYEPWTAAALEEVRTMPLDRRTVFVSINEHQVTRQWATGHVERAALCPWNFTLVTQASAERTWMLRHICRRWRGPIVVAIYVNAGRTYVHQDWTGCGSDQVDFAVVPAETVAAFANHNEYPVNRMRNVAISHVRTTHFIMVDIDLWPDSTLLPRLLAAAKTHPGKFQDHRFALVVAAFAREEKTDCASSTTQTAKEHSAELATCHREAKEMPYNFQTLRSCIIEKKCHIFDRYNHDGHGTTDYKAWLKMDNDAPIRDIKCFLSNRYEPYVVVRNSPLLPKFEEAFTGYGKNKIEHLVHLRYAEWTFAVLPRSYLIHFPHHKSAARLK